MVGLANPGREFAATRHNVGGDTVELLAKRHGSGRLRPEKGLQAAVELVTLGGARVALAVPSTYMNDSGLAVRPLVRRFGIEDPARLVVVHDELDLPPGRVRIKVGGGTAGHNGLKSVQAHLHLADFVRVRIGIGKPSSPQAGADHVLRRPGAGERQLLAAAIDGAADAVEDIVSLGVDEAMNRCNGPP